jgi:hypothetical protein
VIASRYRKGRGMVAVEAEDRVADVLRHLKPMFAGPVERSVADGAEARHPAYDHVGALLADVVLQPGLNYRWVVAPRVNRIIAVWPSAMTVTCMRNVVRRVGSHGVLRWSHKEKPRRYRALLGCCARFGIESVNDLGSWAIMSESREYLAEMRGMGPKSIDYLLRLLGHATVPVDRHLLRVLALAGLQPANYRHAQGLLLGGCDRAGLDPAKTERALWVLFSSGRRACSVGIRKPNE